MDDAFNLLNKPLDKEIGTGKSSEDDSFALPAYLQSADNHNIGDSLGSFSFLDPTTWADKVVDTGKFVAVSAVSGANSIYNSGVAIGNFFGGDFEEANTHALIADYDSDLGRYYDANKESADLAGFIGTSLIPGTLGIKALNAAKAGYVGKNISNAVKLLSPETDIFIERATTELAQSQAVFSALNSNVIKAVGAGVASSALEGAAFEVAVTATMFKSPILENQDLSDLTSNILIGGAVTGVIGGAFGAAGVYGKLKKSITVADEEIKPVAAKSALPKSFSSSEHLITAVNDIERVQQAVIESKLLTPETIEKTRTATLNSLANDVRTNIHELANRDKDLANTVADNIDGMKAEDITSNFFASSSMGRLGTELKEEIASNKNIKKGLEPEHKVAYVKLHGDDAGVMTLDAQPKVPNLADVLPDENAINARVKGMKFSVDKKFDMSAANQLAIEARYLWADTLKDIKAGTVVHEHDFPVLERAYVLNKPISIIDKKNEILTLSGDSLKQHLFTAKQDYAVSLAKSGKMSTEEIAKRANLKQSYLNGKIGNESDFFARQAYKKDYTDKMIAKGLWTQAKGEIPIEYKPQYAKIAYRLKDLDSVDGMVTEGMTAIQQKYKLYMDGVNNAISAAVGDDVLYQQIISLSDRDVLQANRYGAQSGLFSFANGSYDTLASKSQYLGAVTARLENAFVKSTQDAINPVGLQLLNNQEAAIEFATINQKISASAEGYILKGNKLIPRRLQQYLDKVDEFKEAGKTVEDLKVPEFPEGTLMEIPIVNDETYAAIKTHIDVNSNRFGKEQALRAAQGLEHSVNQQTFYPIRKNYGDFKHFAFVVDDKLTNTGHVSMIHAASATELEQLIAKVPKDLRTITKSQSEDFHRAMGDYDYARTLNENYINAKLKRAGADSDYFVQTDPQKIVETWMNDQTKRDRTLAKELVRAKNEKQFLELEKMGEAYTGVAASKYASSLNRIQDTVNNPYANYIKTALNISSIGEHPLLTGFNNIMDKGFSTVVRAIGDTLNSVKKPEDLELINQALEKYGAKGGYYDAATNILANHTAPRGELTKFIRAVNSMVTTLTLRTDPLNALNNAIGSNVLLGAETSFISKAIRQGNTQAVGRLAELENIAIPGSKELIRSPLKLIAQANKEWHLGDIEELKAFYKANGWSSRILEQQRSMLEDLTLKGGESAQVLNSKLSSAFEKFKQLSEKGEKLSLNQYAEEYNRFVAASVIKKYTDLAEEAGIFTREDSIATINTFVNRTQGNMLASQRPLIFQGPVGSAVGLFQTYQFNLMQQLFRHVSEGSAKDAAMMLGLQGSIYGLNGLPAFNFINTHIIGTASGNQQHKDLYSATYGVFGKQAGDWLMYGSASNLLKTNLYTRGDLNPRQLSIIPINPVDIPAVNAVGKLVNNLTGVLSQLGNGANVMETITQGLEHNGFSRPLAGLAQVSQVLGKQGDVYSTDTRGNIVGSNDLLSLASLSRLAGGKPIDEAIATDRYFNQKAYAAKDKARMDSLKEAVKTSVIKGNTPSEKELAKFAYEYAKIGGKQKNFNKFMMNQYTNANTPATEKLANQLSNPLSQNMQEVMKGRDVTTGFEE